MGPWTLLAAANLVSATSIPLKTFPKQTRATCPDSGQTAWDVDFAIYCNTNSPGFDLYTVGDNPVINTSDGDNITDCMNQCQSQWGPCGGTVYESSSSKCWFKTADFQYNQSATVTVNGDTLAIPKASEIQPFPTDCPFNDNSLQQSSDGQNFTIHCQQDIIGADMTPDGAVADAGYPYHTSSLAACMELCTKAMPLCQGVAWNPDLKEGFANCYLKNNDRNPFNFVTRDGSFGGNNATLHSAVGQFPKINSSCSTGSTVQSTGGDRTQYTLTCNQNMPGKDISSFHTTSLQSCVTACDQLTSSHCEGVVFDTNYTSGYNNCRLKSKVGTPQENQNGYIWASPGSSSSSGGSSNAWIAGPVVGAVVAVALIGVIAWFLIRRRRRRNTKQAGTASSYAPIDQQHGQGQWAEDYKTGHNTAYEGGWNGQHPPQQEGPAELSPQDNRPLQPPAELSPQTAKAPAPQELAGGNIPMSELPGSTASPGHGTTARSP